MEALSQAQNTLAILAGNAAHIDQLIIAGDPASGVIRPHPSIRLCDGDLSLALGQQGGEYEIDLGGLHSLLETALYTEGPVALSVQAWTDGAWQTIPGLDHVVIGGSGAGWYGFPMAATTGRLRFVIHGPGAGLAEVVVTGSPINALPPRVQILSPLPGDIVDDTVTVVGMVDDPEVVGVARHILDEERRHRKDFKERLGKY